MTSVRKLSALTGVSPATISKFLNNPLSVSPKIREKLTLACKKYNYSPPVLKRNKRIAILIENGNIIFESLYVSTLTGHLIESLEKNGLRFSIKTVKGLQEIPETLDWIISLLYHKEIAKDLFFKEIPAVFINEPLNMKGMLIKSDHFQGVELAVEYLLRNGHKKICYIGKDNSSKTAVERKEAFEKIVKKRGLSISLCVFRKDPDLYEIVSKIKNNFTAVILGSQYLTLLFYKVCKILNLSIPEDLSVISYESINLSERLYPPLTTIAQPFKEISWQAVVNLKEMIEKNKIKEEEKVLPYTLIERDSVKCML